MARYPKPRNTRTMDKGLRSFPPQSRDEFSQEAIRKMEERIERILIDNRIPNEEACWIIRQALLAVAFRQATANEERNEVMTKMKQHKDKGHSLGFSEDQIGAINRVVLQKDQSGQLEGFSQKLTTLKRRED